MYQTGDLIVYGSTGVCRVERVLDPKEGQKVTGMAQAYYLLKPFYQDGTVYAPVSRAEQSMRPVITAQEAEQLIRKIPQMQAQAYHGHSTQELREHYQALTDSHSCEDLIELTMSIYAKKQDAAEHRRRVGQVDERFMKKGEELLYGEFAAALGIPRDEVQSYISRRVEELTDGKGDAGI